MSSSPVIYRSPLKPVDLETSSIFSFLFKNKSNFDDNAPAFIDAQSGELITRGQLYNLSLSLAQTVKQNGGKRGDVAMIFSPNSIIWPVVLLGLNAAGLRATLANSSYTPPELAHQVKDSGAQLIFVAPSLFPILLETFKLIGISKEEAVKRVVIMRYVSRDTEEDKAAGIGEEWKRLDEFFVNGKLSSEEKFEGAQTDETALLCYSSGTTGLSKGVESTQRNIVSLLQVFRPMFPPIREGDLSIAVLPFYHIFAIKVLLFNFWSIEKYKATTICVVPPILVVLSIHPIVDAHDLRSLRLLFSGAAPLGTGLVNKVLDKFKSKGNNQLVITQGYGLTETSPTTNFLQVEHALNKIGSCGLLVPNLECRLVDDDEKDVIPGPENRGELWYRGPTIMKGYLNNAAATKNSITPDGWFKTGDIAIRDNEGFFTVVDRKKELIKYKGFQVPPADLEGVLITHPEIADAGVIGIESLEQATELPRAYIVSTKNATLLGPTPAHAEARAAFEKEVQTWIKTKVASHKHLRGGVVIIEAIPKSAAGKILRRQLRDLAKAEKAKESTSVVVKAKL